MRRTIGQTWMALTLLAISAAACSKDSTGPAASVDPGNGTAVQLKGTLANVTLSGDIDITIAATGTTVTGCVYLKSTTCGAVTGTYSTGTKALNFSVASPALTFTGTYSNGVVQGTFTAASGDGVFVVRNGTVSVFCGTFAGAASGTWNFTISGSSLVGVYDDGGGNNYLSGTANGNALAITFSAGTAAGTISGTSATGTWTSGGGNGTWTGGTAGCRS